MIFVSKAVGIFGYKELIEQFREFLHISLKITGIFLNFNRFLNFQSNIYFDILSSYFIKYLINSFVENFFFKPSIWRTK